MCTRTCDVPRYDKPNKVSKGSSLKLLMVAEGAAHIYPRFAPTMEWDTCAAHAIVECAGGVVLQAEGDVPSSPGQPVVYNKENLRNPFFVVKGKVIDKSKKKAKKNVTLGGEEEKSGMNPMLIVLVRHYAHVCVCPTTCLFMSHTQLLTQTTPPTSPQTCPATVACRLSSSRWLPSCSCRRRSEPDHTLARIASLGRGVALRRAACVRLNCVFAF